MQKMNMKMLKLFLEEFSSHKLSFELTKILNSDFIVESECYFLKNLYDQVVHSKEDFQDKTGYECFVNSIHIDDYSENNFYAQAYLFSKALIDKWNILNNKLVLEVVIAQTDYGFNVKFHVLRKGEEWINISELEKFDEAVAILHSN